MCLDNGTIMILGPDINNVGRKVFDLKITQTFPIISINRAGSILSSRKTKDMAIEKYDHLSIPPDLNLHLTGDTGYKKHLKFKTDLVNYPKWVIKSRLFILVYLDE